MKAQQRPLIAAIAAAAVNGKTYSTTYDYQSGENASTRVQVVGRQVIAFDADSGAHFLGGLPSLYDIEQDRRLTLEIAGNLAKGRDPAAADGFTLRVEGSLVVFHDEETGEYYNFAVNQETGSAAGQSETRLNS